MTACGLAGLGLGVLLAALADRYRLTEQASFYTVRVAKLLLIISLATTAILKAEGQFYTYNLIAGETKLAQLESDSLANAFYGFSPFFQKYIGYIIVAGLTFLAFGRTTRLGSLMLFFSLGNAVVLNYSFESCYLLKNSLYLSGIVAIMYQDLPHYLSFFSGKQGAKEGYHPLSMHQHLYQASMMMRIILLSGLYFYTMDYVKDVAQHWARNTDNPISGVWEVESVSFLNSVAEEPSTKDILGFDKIILDQGRFGAIKVDDSLSYFEYLIDTNYNQLELWNFKDYWDMDWRGKYYQTSPTTMYYLGRNLNDSILIELKLDTPSIPIREE